MNNKALTEEQRGRIVSAYLTGGLDVARPVAIACGVSPHHAARLVRETRNPRPTKGRRISGAQRDAMISAYLTGGFDAAKPLAVACGVSPRYIAKLLRNRGIANTTKRGVYKRGRYGESDPRWQRAIAIGQVIA